MNENSVRRNLRWVNPHTRTTDPVCQARLGIPPEVLGDAADERLLDGAEMPCPLPCPLPLTAAEVEVLLCFALTSPLHYGPIEEGLCDKLQRHLRASYTLYAVPAPTS
jgi:hypothetical protein